MDGRRAPLTLGTRPADTGTRHTKNGTPILCAKMKSWFSRLTLCLVGRYPLSLISLIFHHLSRFFSSLSSLLVVLSVISVSCLLPVSRLTSLLPFVTGIVAGCTNTGQATPTPQPTTLAFCPADATEGETGLILWPATQGGYTATVACPYGEWVGNATRLWYVI